MDKFKIIVALIAVAIISLAYVIVVDAKRSQPKVISTVNIKTERIDGTYYRLITLPDGRRFIASTHWVIPLDTVDVDPNNIIEKE